MREVERKFRASRDLALPELAERVSGVAAIDGPEDLALVAVYYDTADLRLAREGITLRHRDGGIDDGWHLKLPIAATDSFVREEIQISGDDDIPDRLRRAVTAYVRFSTLQPAATLITQRNRRVLRGPEGEPLAEVVDDTVTVEGIGRVSAGFREIEVEDLGGGEDVLAGVGELLREAGAVGGEFMPKLVRALGARASAAPDPPLPEPVTTRSTAGDVITGYLRSQVRALLAQDVRFRVGGDDGVHQMRVATRRLRTALRVFAPFLEEEWAAPLHEGLGWLAETLGAARDAEVILARLGAAVDQLPAEKVLGPVQARLEQHLGGTLATAVAELEKITEGDRYLSLLESLVDAAWRPRTTERADELAQAALPDVVRAAWRKLRTGVARVRQSDDEGDYHEVRIAAKRLRYAAEAVAPAFGRSAQRLAKQMERVQDVLGEYVDAVAAQRTLREVARTSAGRPVGFTLGLLHAAEEQKAAVARVDFAMLWPEVARRRYRDWLAA